MKDRFLPLLLATFCSFPALPLLAQDAWSFFPVRPTFRPLLGDPREPVLGLMPYADKGRFEGALGGTVELIRYVPPDSWQFGFGVFGGIFLLADSPSLETFYADAWAVGLEWSVRREDLSLRFRFQDEKSYLGDALYQKGNIEYHPYDPENPLSSRFVFTRDHYDLLLSWDATRDLRLYAGGGLRHILDDFNPYESQTSLVAGLEAFTAPFQAAGSSCRGFLTYHFKYQDQAGSTTNHSLQAGLSFQPDPSSPRSLRLSLVYFNGKSEFWHFFKERDEHLGLGLFFDP